MALGQVKISGVIGGELIAGRKGAQPGKIRDVRAIRNVEVKIWIASKKTYGLLTV